MCDTQCTYMALWLASAYETELGSPKRALTKVACADVLFDLQCLKVFSHFYFAEILQVVGPVDGVNVTRSNVTNNTIRVSARFRISCYRLPLNAQRGTALKHLSKTRLFTMLLLE